MTKEVVSVNDGLSVTEAFLYLQAFPVRRERGLLLGSGLFA
jgi:hypothetical protein